MAEKKYAAVYCRVSTKAQVEDGVSLEVQEEECRHEARRYGYEVFDVFVDEGISGTKLKRDRLQDLIDLVRTQTEDSKILDAIIVYDLSRLSRSIKHTMELFKLFDRKSVKLISIKDGLNGENDAISRKIITVVLSLLSELYIDQLRLKVPAGMRKSAEGGRWQGGNIPLGYDLLPEQDENGNYIYNTSGGRKRMQRRLYINEQEAEVVRLIFNMALQGKGAYSITKYLNNNGYKSKKGGIFRSKSILDILHNNLYTGKLDWGKSFMTIEDEDTGKKKQHFRSKSIVEDIEGLHDAIIDEDTFNKVQVLIDKRKEDMGMLNDLYFTDDKGVKRRKKANDHLYSDILQCPKCGGKMLGGTQSRTLKDGTKIKEVYYKCYNWSGSGLCSPNSLKEDNIKEIITKQFYRGFEAYYFAINNVRNEADGRAMINNKIDKYLQEYEQLQKNQSAIERQIKTLINNVANQPNEEIKNRYEQVIAEKQQEIINLDKRITEVQEMIIQEENKIDQLKKEFSEFGTITDAKLYFESLEEESQRALLNKVIKKIVIEKPNFKNYLLKEIEYNFDETLEEICELMGVPKTKAKEIKDKLNTKLYEGDLQDLVLSISSATVIIYCMEGTDGHKARVRRIRNHVNNLVQEFIISNNMQPLELEQFEPYVQWMYFVDELCNGNKEAMVKAHELFKKLNPVKQETEDHVTVSTAYTTFVNLKKGELNGN